MNNESHLRLKIAINGIAFAGIFLIMAGLIWLMYHYTQPPPPDTAYWAERKRNLSELNAQNKELLENYGWVDQTRGIVRLPVARAMELTVGEWREPAAGRSNLLARADKVAPPPAPPAPSTPKTNTPAGAITK